MNDIVKQQHDALQSVHQSNATSLLVAIQQAASNPQVDIEKMERLFAMHQQMVRQEAESAFNAAMARAQSRIVPVANNAANTQTNSRYAKLAAINKAITPIYTAEGISISFDTADCPIAGYLRTVAIVSHSSGHSRSYHLDMPPDDVGAKGNVNKTAVHATGSTSSYSRRYLVCMIFNVTTEDDNDGNHRKTPEGLPDKVRADFECAIDALVDRPSGEILWKQIAAACFAVKDQVSNDALKAKLVAKVATFKKDPQ